MVSHEDVANHNVEKYVGYYARNVAPVCVFAVLVVDAVTCDGKNAAGHLPETREKGVFHQPVFEMASEDEPKNQDHKPAVDEIEQKKSGVAEHKVNVPHDPTGCFLYARLGEESDDRVFVESVVETDSKRCGVIHVVIAVRFEERHGFLG
mmetsp:Transcript_7233/g.17637  ORF Transcript_7233/g.17637 Transcript_7233/m.17637 type:complete len:150 (-) Transcript_7233:167-616(-)